MCVRHAHLASNSEFLSRAADRGECHTKSVKNKTPQEAWSGYKPSVSHLKIFGCIAYAQVPKAKRKKLDDRGEKCIFIGYSEESKAYKLYNPLTNKVVVSRDVIFNEEESWNWDKEEKIKENQIEIEEQEADHREQNQENMRQTISTPAPCASSSTVRRSLDTRLITPEDIVYGVGLLSRYMETPKESHWLAAKRILRYISGTLEFGLFYSYNEDAKLYGYSDSDWGGDQDERKSTTRGFRLDLRLPVFSLRWCMASSEGEMGAGFFGRGDVMVWPGMGGCAQVGDCHVVGKFNACTGPGGLVYENECALGLTAQKKIFVL
ncbi:hypothetical protein HHK36_032960 [Tetracentron sinense]|uniref:Retroviral polymerase SH3-like domain-containing protein n=1 Tax=Tetracentron sinense TaxID=13715 RepID=A0A834Y450_TETSI|nr:hypothetical protein HHK36_032960 [Tetracentron sinense]